MFAPPRVEHSSRSRTGEHLSSRRRQVTISLAKQTFQQFAANQDSRIKAMYPFAGERAGVLVVDVKSHDELQELIGNLPFAGIVSSEIHPVGTVNGALKSIEAAERRIASMMPAGVR